jgi:hypothetical protein
LPSICSPAFFAVEVWSGLRAHDPDVPADAADDDAADGEEDEVDEVDAALELPADPDPDPDDEHAVRTAVRTKAVAVAASAAAARWGILMPPNATSIR